MRKGLACSEPAAIVSLKLAAHCGQVMNCWMMDVNVKEASCTPCEEDACGEEEDVAERCKHGHMTN